MASQLVSPLNSLTLPSSSSNPARGFPLLPLHSTSSSSSISSSSSSSSSRLVCFAHPDTVAATVKTSSLDKILPTPRRNISVGPLCSSKLGTPSVPIRLLPNNRSNFSITRTMAADGESSSRFTNLNLDDIMDKARTYWDKLPPPIKSFPWNKALDEFLQIIFDLTLTVMKYLAAPLLLGSSVSEMLYCARVRKLSWVPIPFAIGFAAAGVLKVTAEELYPFLKDTYVPWHLIAASILFAVLKLPGPYYPFWGKIFIPHFANGGLVRIIWLVYSWYRSPQKNADS